jgi:hypothetical protein
VARRPEVFLADSLAMRIPEAWGFLQMGIPKSMVISILKWITIWLFNIAMENHHF